MATMNKAAKRVRGLIRATREWCADPKRDTRQETQDTAQKYLRSKEPRAVVVAASQLDHLAYWNAQHGLNAILNAEPQGWAYLDRAFHYGCLNALIEDKVIASVPACLLAAAITYEEESMEHALAPKLLKGLDEGTMVYDFAPFAVFMLKLWGLYRRRDINIARPNVPPLGVYQAVLDAWHDETALPVALGAACDYHLEQTMGDEGYPEFDMAPQTLFPVDILAIGTVRRKLGLGVPNFFHPLMNTSLTKVPPAAERPRMGPDPLLDEVRERAYVDGFLLRPGATPPTPEQRIDHTGRQLRERHAHRDSAEQRNQALQRLRAAVAGTKPFGADKAAGQLLPLAEWHARRGMLAIIDGKSEGWADIDRAFFYRAWSVRVRRSPVASAARVLANALVFNEVAMAQHLGAKLIASLKDFDLLHGWAETRFGAFMAKLWGLCVEQPVDLVGSKHVGKIAPLGPYQGILDAWRDEGALASALVRACEYHMDQAHPSVGGAEFVEVPYSLFPVDILAIGAVRTKLGLTTPHIDHPILNTPLAVVPPDRRRMGSDPLLDQVLEKAKKEGLL